MPVQIEASLAVLVREQDPIPGYRRPIRLHFAFSTSSASSSSQERQSASDLHPHDSTPPLKSSGMKLPMNESSLQQVKKPSHFSSGRNGWRAAFLWLLELESRDLRREFEVCSRRSLPLTTLIYYYSGN